MKTSKNTTLSIGILFAAFAVALALRLIRLGVLPLGDQEASLALQALAVARGETAPFGSFAAYVGLTGFDFYLFSSGNFLARFWFALCGSSGGFCTLAFPGADRSLAGLAAGWRSGDLA